MIDTTCGYSIGPSDSVRYPCAIGPPNGPAVMTDHANGLITMNVEEADDVKCEKIKHDLHEPYRTLLGHFRHEVGHYCWDLLVRDRAWYADYQERAERTIALVRLPESEPI